MQDPSPMEAAVMKGRADRFSEALSASAGSEARIKDLEEALAVSEYHREIAERQLWGMGDELSNYSGKVWTAADGDPVTLAVLDLHDGTVWARNDVNEEWTPRTGGRWASKRWPLDGGPWVAFDDSWALNHFLDAADDMQFREGMIRDAIHLMDGYRADGDKTRSDPNLVEAVERVIATLELKRVRAAKEGADALVKYAEIEANITPAMADASKLERPTVFEMTVTRHTLVKEAEGLILRAASVPEDGDPEYDRAGLLRAISALCVAADFPMPHLAEVPAPDDGLPF